MAKSVLSRYLDPEVLSRMADRHIEPRGLVMGNLAGRISRRCRASPSSSPAIANTSPATIPSTSTGGSTSPATSTSSSNTRWRRTSSAILMLDCSASMRYGEEREQKLLYAAQMATTLGYSIIRQSDKVSLATFDDRLRGFVPPSNSMAQVVRMTEHLDEIEAGRKNADGRMPDRTRRPNAAPRDRDDLQRFLHRSRRPGSGLAADALQPPRSRAVSGDAPRRIGVRVQRHDQVRRPGDSRRTAGPARRPAPRLPEGRGEVQHPLRGNLPATTASSASSSTPAATWARCSSTI